MENLPDNKYIPEFIDSLVNINDNEFKLCIDKVDKYMKQHNNIIKLSLIKPLDNDNKIIDNDIGVRVLEGYLSRGLIPILYGDAVIKVLNNDVEFKILSGDDISWYLAGKLNASKLLFATSVNGIYDRDPSHPDARLLKEISLDEIGYIGSKLRGYDVTGGMLNKLKSGIMYVNVLPKDLEVIVFNGLVEDNIYKALKGTLETYTKVKI